MEAHSPRRRPRPVPRGCSRSIARVVPVELLFQPERSFAGSVAERALHGFAVRRPVEDGHLRDLEVDRMAELQILERDGRESPAPEEALITALAGGEAEVRRAACVAFHQYSAPWTRERLR